jgi:hypothetical protein
MEFRHASSSDNGRLQIGVLTLEMPQFCSARKCNAADVRNEGRAINFRGKKVSAAESQM